MTVRCVLASAGACVVLAIGVAWAPVMDHQGDADVACGSLFAHTRASNAVPATATTTGHAATASFDSCPGSVYNRHTSIVLALTGCSAVLALLALATSY